VVLRVCVLVWLIAYLSGAYVAAARQNGSNSSGTDAGSSTDSNSSSDVRSSGASAQQATPTPALITQAVDDRVRTRLVGNVHPLAQTKFDQGEAPADMPMQRMLLVLKRSAQQEAALRGLIDAQQNKNSANFHQWLTPAEFGAQFGPGDSDIAAVTGWLRASGFQVSQPSNGRTVIEFSGTAGLVKQAFQTAIHKYVVKGEPHWANASEPSIPTALAPAVAGVVTLHNFPRRSYATLHGMPLPAVPSPDGVLPLFTFTQQQTTYYGLGPADFATIYNVLPLWSAGIDGTGQTIAIVGETNIHVTDIENFRTLFGLPAKDPQIILNGPDPGIDGDETEAILDVSWSGAVAKNATIDLVVSASTESTLGVDLSALYIVDNNLAPIMSESYGICEATVGNAGNSFYNALWQQAAAQGITVLVAAGDGGSAGCDDFDDESEAMSGLAVSGFASTPYNVAVGGTDFDQTATTAPTYWSATNNATTGASALSYIPETTWNDSCAGMGVAQCVSASNFLDIVSGSGGPSSCATQNSGGTCVSGYSKPSWQTGTGVPMDGVRDLPDVSLFASNGFNNSFYILCEADAGFFGSQETCSLTNDTFVGVGGTSASAPAFAGIMALVNQKMAMTGGAGTRQGNANYVLYKLAAQAGASCDSSTVALTGTSCIFYDITKGNNSVPCVAATPNCGPPTLAGNYGILVDPNNSSNPAWLTTAGYDLATGLGSVNANNLVNAWSNATFTSSTTTLTNLAPTSITHGQAVNVSVKVTPQTGTGTPTGAVALMATPMAGQDIGVQSFPLSNGTASGTTTLLPGGTYNVTAHYAGDATYGASDSAGVSVTVEKENSKTNTTMEAFDPNTYSFYATNTIPYGTIFFLRSDVTDAAGKSCIPNPQETQAGCPSGTVTLTNNGQALDGGSFPLNSQGYTEDQTLTPEFTTIGNYAIQAQYGGDNSYNASTGSSNLAVTQAPTILDYFGVSGACCEGTITMYSGQSFQVYASAFAYSVLQAPSGSVVILQNGSAPSGTNQAFSLNGSYNGNYSTALFNFAYVSDTLTTSIDTPGTYNFTATYPGDAYYSGSQNTWPLQITVVDTTFNISTPIANITIPAPGQTGTATVNLVGTDNFFGGITVACALPAAMTEATCPTVVTTIDGPSATAMLTITTTAPHPIGASRPAATGASASASGGLLGLGVLAGVYLLGLPGARRRRLAMALWIFAGAAVLGSCGGGGNNGGGGGGGETDPGTPAGTYTVTVTATSSGITRTGTFSVTVQ
ncbi:MAG: Ig-like domain repeat protein, partial [Candidatus Acidiferrales bacterium]